MKPATLHRILGHGFGFRSGWARCVLWGTLFGCLSAHAEGPAISSGFIYPAGDTGAPDPTDLYTDARTGEIVITDAPGARLIVFDADRRYTFEFSTRDRLSGLRQAAVDQQGRFFVLGDTRQHTLGVFDYNGDFLRYLDLTDRDGQALAAVSFVVDGDDRLCVLTAEPAHLYVFTTDGERVRDFEFLAQQDQETRQAPVLGRLSLIHGDLALPLPMMGNVAVYTTRGEFVRLFGFSGGGPGELSFPIAATATATGGYAVLDKHRHCISLYDETGKWQREVGGYGISEGRFYHPTTLTTCVDGALAVGQSYRKRVQVVDLLEAPVAESHVAGP